ncbi:DUF6531 domain-containing protein [Actinoallomurus iriomotensis]|uniref:Uncharacterized protein n=1 Tax=Actinoallomurus iriomotensis TaxID=478107 RepID=A0A9W6S211_9ACTN|nr:DUF6531 domain-containing protein [Actinoallomurus iriomotensis]GLY85649.1 hypothetical protein Airi02_035780 [Actinoallomurus iriomotensis]
MVRPGGKLTIGVFSAVSHFLREAGVGVADVGRKVGARVRYAARPVTTPAFHRLAKADPVDVASGEVLLCQTDVELPGVLPLVLSRTHISSYRLGGWFGTSWASTLDQRLEAAGPALRFVGADGMVLDFPIPEAGASVEPMDGPRLSLRRDGGGFTLSDPTGESVLRFEGGPSVFRLIRVEDRNRNHIDIGYENDGSIARIEHSGGYRIQVETTAGRITGFRLRDSVLVRFGYDGAGNLAKVTDPSDRSLSFSYDADGRLTGWRDSNDCWYRYTYDEAGRCVRAEGKGGFLNAAFEYDPQGRWSAMTDSLGHRHGFEFNERGRVVAEVDPLGNRTTSTWDGRDRLLARTDPLGHTTRYEYDDNDNIVAVERPDGHRIGAEYNDLNLPVRITEADGSAWRQEYDARGNLTAVINPLGAETRYGYDEYGRLCSVADAVGGIARIRPNTAGLPLEVVAATGAVTRYAWDAFGRLSALEGPVTGPTRFGWTAESELAWWSGPGSAVERSRYDGEGNLLEHTDGAGRVTRYTYTDFDLVSARIDPDGARWEFRHDTELRLVAVTDPAGSVWRYEYDPAGNLVAETDFNGRRLAYAYDAAGRTIECRNGNGEVLRLVRDQMGNVVEERQGDRVVATFAYDRLGRLIRARNTDAEIVFTRDALGQVVAESCNGRTASFAFDAAGRRVRRTTPAGVETIWRYDLAGRPETLVVAGRTMTFGYDQYGRETARGIGGHTMVSQRWDPAHRLVSQIVRSATAVSQHRGYAYRADGVLAGIDEQIGGPRRFTADASGRIVGVESAAAREEYAYDAAGNLIAAGWPLSEATAEDPRGRREYAGSLLRRAGGLVYEHDAHGRLVARRSATSPTAWHFIWDVHDRLVGITTPGGDRWRYRYDPLGRRIAKQRFDAKGSLVEQTDFTWDDQVLAEQSSGNDVSTWEHLPGSFRPVAQIERSRFHAVITDALGTPTDLVDESGRLTALRHSLWGHSGTPFTPLRHPGQYHDPESGLYYNNNRYYDPATARYLSADPLGLGGGPNPHAYVANPLQLADPLGLVPCLPIRPDGETVLSGHGAYYPRLGKVTVPEGTSVAFYADHGEKNWVTLDGAHSPYVWAEDRMVPNMAAVEATGKVQPIRVFHAGQEIPNYTLYGPRFLPIYGKSKVVYWPTDLSSLLKPNMGRVHWAACQVETKIPPRAGLVAPKVIMGVLAYEGYKIYQVYDLHHEQGQLAHKMNDLDISPEQYAQVAERYDKVSKQLDDWSMFKP